jgi:hypothetical protein
MTQRSSILEIEGAPFGVLLWISAETVIDQSKMDTLWQRRKSAVPGFCHISLQGGGAAPSDRRFGKEVKLRTRFLLQNPAGWAGFGMVRDLGRKKNRVPGFCAKDHPCTGSTCGPK